MALDYQMSVYRWPSKSLSKTSTSYSRMSDWLSSRKGSGAPPRTPAPAGLLHKITSDVPVHLRYNQISGYDDFHRAFRALSTQWPPGQGRSTYGPPRVRHGRAGGCWRHVTEVMQAEGKRAVFVDGRVRSEDNCRSMDNGQERDSLGYLKVHNEPDTNENTPLHASYSTTNIRHAVEHDNWQVVR